MCHTIEILQDDICEYPPNEFFFSDLAYVSGVMQITIAPQTAQVVIDDERECSKGGSCYLVMCWSLTTLRVWNVCVSVCDRVCMCMHACVHIYMYTVCLHVYNLGVILGARVQ